MPIYAYKCTSCGFAQDEMQKVSDAQLTVCPSCGKADYAKQVTAAGFALKGSGGNQDRCPFACLRHGCLPGV